MFRIRKIFLRIRYPDPTQLPEFVNKKIFFLNTQSW
jgi:hypothetical protein